MKVGVLGLGSIGTRHVRNLWGMGHTVLPFDPDANKKGVLSRDSVIAHADAMVIASPTAQHYQDLLDCIATGKPVFVEKPIAATEQEWRELKHHDGIKRAFVGFNLRFHHCVIRAKKWLDDGLIGKPLWANFTVAQKSDKPQYLRDGVILNFASHEVDAALHLLGPAKVSCASSNSDESMAVFAMTHENGCMTTVHADYMTDPEIRSTRIVGEKGEISFDVPGRRCQILDSDGRLVAWPQLDGSFDEDYIAEMRAFIDRIEGKETLGATGEDGLAALTICLDAKKLAGLAT